jgi:CheY-like chemotaxis protein
MKLLIVEDNSVLGELTAELLHSLDRQAQHIEAITLVSDLQTAMLCLPEHDVVLCDGTFPLSHNSRFVVEEWDVVRLEANRRGIHFVLYSGSVRALDCARESNTPALAKTAATEEIYAALMSFAQPVSNRGYRELAQMTEKEKLAGEQHVPSL